jgi:predicted transcriptional regulator
MLGRFPVVKYEQMAVDAALKRTSDAGLTKAELTAYLVNYESVAAFRVGALELSRSPQSLLQLQSAFSFSPPQSFLVLSRDGQRALDTALGFSGRKMGQHR